MLYIVLQMKRANPLFAFQPTIQNRKFLKPARRKLRHGEISNKINLALDFYRLHAARIAASAN